MSTGGFSKINSLAIVAGSGYLPRRLAEDARHHGISYRVFHRPDMSLDWVKDHPNQTFTAETAGSALKSMTSLGLKNVVLAGGMGRPDFKLWRLDFATLRIAARIFTSLKHGDDGTLRRLITLLEGEGLSILSAQELCPDLLISEGAITTQKPSKAEATSREKGRAILDALSPMDNGQGCVIAGTKCLAIETVFGTDAMLDFVIKNHPKTNQRRGFLLKMPKQNQDLRADLPSIGPDTIDKIAQTDLAGIMLPAGAAFVLDRDEVIRRANEVGLFVYGFPL